MGALNTKVFQSLSETARVTFAWLQSGTGASLLRAHACLTAPLMLAATVTAQAGPAVVPTLPNTNATVYDASATCATVPKTAQMVPDMTDFLAGLQVVPCCLVCIAWSDSIELCSIASY